MQLHTHKHTCTHIHTPCTHSHLTHTHTHTHTHKHIHTHTHTVSQEFILSFCTPPRCHTEQASNQAETSSMARAVDYNHYDSPPSTSSTAGGVLPPYSRNISPPYQSLHERHNSHYPPNLETRSRVEPTPTTSTIDSEEQLRNAIRQLPPERLKDLILDATLNRTQQPQQARVPVLLSRSPDQREKKIDYFVNTLNFPREKVESVLDSLGPDAADNDILERLVKVCRPTVKPGSSYNPPQQRGKYPGAGGGTNGECMTPPSQLSPPLPMTSLSPAPPVIRDPARLRHIVIDGSNVAMR